MEKIIERDGVRYEAVKLSEEIMKMHDNHSCMACDYGNSYVSCKIHCTTGCKGFHCYKRIKENKMKLADLMFKCVAPSVEAETKIKNLLGIDTIGIGNAFICCVRGDYSSTSSSQYFCSWTEPLMSYEQALDLIAQVEKPEPVPEFDIKPFDRVICRCKEKNARWNCDFFNFMERNIIYVVGFHTGTGMQVIKADGNEHLIGTADTPPGWWECENGKPVWRTK